MSSRKPRRSALGFSALMSMTLALIALTPTTGLAQTPSETIINVVRTGSAIQEVFNPYLPVTAFGQSGTGTRNMMIYEPLVMVNPIKAGDFKPWLATEWEWTPDGKQMTAKLREGVMWSDGTPFTSADVVNSYQTIIDNPALNLRGIELASVAADGDYGVVFTFDEPYSHRFDKLVQLEITPKHIYGEQADLTMFTDPKPVGTGPFLLDTFSNESFQIKRNPTYWQPGKPAIGGLMYRTVKDNNAIALALVQGEADWGSGNIPNVDEVFTSKSPDFRRFWPVLGSDGLITNNATFPFNELAIRQAVSIALDRQQVADVAKRQGATNPVGLPLPVFQDVISDAHQDARYEYDPAKAAQMLADIGFAAGPDGTLVRDGVPLQFTITIPQAFTEQVSAAQVIQAQLEPLGIRVNIDGVAVEAIDGITTKGEFQATIGYPIATQILAYNLYDSWMNPKYVKPVGEAIPTKQNIQRTDDPVLQGYFDDYIAATDDAGRAAAMEKLEGYFIDNVPWIVLSYYQGTGQWSEAKATGWPTEENPYWESVPNPVVAIELQPK